MPQKGSVFEIELKALLSKEEFERLQKELPQKMVPKKTETLATIRFRPGDLRLRFSDKRFEIVYKDKNPTDISRTELTIPLKSKKEVDSFLHLFERLGFKADPSWKSHRTEFECALNGFSYSVCLQRVENFAYLLEVEYESQKDEPQIHEPNLQKIIQDLGLVPIKPDEFSEKINEYRGKNAVP